MKKLILLILVALSFVSCGGKNIAVTQVDTYAYILIKGATTQEKVFLDDNKAIVLGKDTKEYTLDSGENASKVRISEGAHLLKITRNGKMIINRKFYVSPGNTFEVNL